MDIFKEYQRFLELLRKEPEESIGQIFTLFCSEISDFLTRQLLLDGQFLNLEIGDLIFSEDAVSPHIKGSSQIFIVLAGQVFARKRVTEASHQTTTYDKGDIVGVEKLIAWLGQQKNIFPTSTYRETAMADKGTVLIGLTADQCISFLKLNPRSLVSQLKRWIERAASSEQLLLEFAQIAKGMELDLQSLGNAEKVIHDLIEAGEDRTLAAIFVKFNQTFHEYNSFFLQLEKESRNKDERINKLHAKYHGACAAFMELLSSQPSKTQSILFKPAAKGQPHVAQQVDELIEALRNK